MKNLFLIIILFYSPYYFSQIIENKEKKINKSKEFAIKYDIKEVSLYEYKSSNLSDSILKLYEAYDSNGCLTLKKEYDVYSTKNKSFRITFFKNDTSGNRIEERQFSSLGTDFTQETVYEYINDSMVLYKFKFSSIDAYKKYRIIKRNDYINEPSVIKHDTIGRIVLKIYEEEKYIYHYSDSGRYSIDYRMNDPNDPYCEKMTYDKKHNMIEYFIFNHKKRFIVHFKYKYSKSGKKIEKISLNSKNEIIYYTKYEYLNNDLITGSSSYDKNSKLLSYKKYFYTYY